MIKTIEEIMMEINKNELFEVENEPEKRGDG